MSHPVPFYLHEYFVMHCSEIMLCDFTAGVKPISFLNIVKSPNRAATPPGVPPDYQNLPYTIKMDREFDRPESVRAVEAGSWANRFPGELRIKINYSRLISFYDADLFPSLQNNRSGKERWDHSLKAVSKEEVEIFLDKVGELFAKQDISSGIDWQALFNVVTNRYSRRLEMLRHILNPGSTPTNPALDKEYLRKAHRYVSIMLTPYRLFDVVPPKGDTGNGDMYIYDWATPIFKNCATSHINYLWLDEVILSHSEKLLLTAIRDVSDREEYGRTAGRTTRNLDNKDANILLASWRKSVSDLIWSIWIRCLPECGYGEMCYLPT